MRISWRAVHPTTVFVVVLVWFRSVPGRMHDRIRDRLVQALLEKRIEYATCPWARESNMQVVPVGLGHEPRVRRNDVAVSRFVALVGAGRAGVEVCVLQVCVGHRSADRL